MLDINRGRFDLEKMEWAQRPRAAEWPPAIRCDLGRSSTPPVYSPDQAGGALCLAPHAPGVGPQLADGVCTPITGTSANDDSGVPPSLFEALRHYRVCPALNR
jgi:hypothetical protein